MDTETTKAKQLYIDDDGFEWRKGPTITLGTIQTWRCTFKTCSGYAHSRVGTTDLVIATAHNHEPIQEKGEVERCLEYF